MATRLRVRVQVRLPVVLPPWLVVVALAAPAPARGRRPFLAPRQAMTQRTVLPAQFPPGAPRPVLRPASVVRSRPRRRTR